MTKENNVPQEDNDLENESIVNTSDDEDPMPKNYIFPSFYVFMLWGPFASVEDRLPLLLTDETNKSKKECTRSQRRLAEKKEKVDDSAHDSSAARGFSTDQRINIETLNVQKQNQIDRIAEAAIVAISVEESAIARQVEAAEKRAIQRYPEYNADNYFWKRSDELLQRQQDIMQEIREMNTKKVENNEKGHGSVSEFLNAESPVKESKKRSSVVTSVDLSNNSSDSDVSVVRIGKKKKDKVSNSK